MSRTTYFVQECPTCGRHIHVPVSLLGKLVACQHCRGEFEAFDSEARPATAASPLSILDRVEALLQADFRGQVSR